MKKHMTFRFDLEQEDDGRWLASIHECPGLMCYGDSVQEAITAALDLWFRVVVDKLEHGELITDRIAELYEKKKWDAVEAWKKKWQGLVE